MTDEPHDRDQPSASPCRRTDRHDSHHHEAYMRPFLCPGVTEPADQAAVPRCAVCHRPDDGSHPAVCFPINPADRAELRDRIAAAIADALQPRYGGPQHNTPGGLPLTATAEEVRLHRAQPLADAVLAVLSAAADRADWDALVCPTGELRQRAAEQRDRADELAARVEQLRIDRTTVLHEAADLVWAMDYETDANDYGFDSIKDAWDGGTMDASKRLRRLADEAGGEPS